MTRLCINWHLGIPDGEQTYKEEIPYNDNLMFLAAYTKELLPKTELFKQYDPSGFKVETNYGQIEVYNKDHYDLEERVATIEISHFLLIGNTKFKLIQEV